MLALHDLHIPDYERVVSFTDDEVGMRGIVAIYSTALGPGAGGCRHWRYSTEPDAFRDALKLAKAMSYKNALAELPLGGAKAVILARDGVDRTALFEAFGRVVEHLGGSYVTAEDAGTSVEDMRIVAGQTQYVSGVEWGDPSPSTALGVLSAMREAVRLRHGANTLKGITVAVQGVGHVGGELCRLLRKEGANLVIADSNAAVMRRAADRFAASVEPSDRIHTVRCDVFAPCALGGVLTDRSIRDLRTGIVCGAANNQLETEQDGQRLRERGILYVPDYVANAGGIINVAAEYFGWSENEVRARIDAIAPRLATIREIGERENLSLNIVADRMAARRLSKGAALAAAG